MNAPAVLTAPVRHPLTVDEFLLLSEAGAFRGNGRTELIDGDIYVVNALPLPHARISVQLAIALDAVLPPPLEVAAAPSVKLSDTSLPEPDLVVHREKQADLLTLEQAVLVIEVADSSLGFDLGPKLQLYATAGVPEYWVVDVNGREIRQFWQPERETYAEQRTYRFGACIPLAVRTDIVVPTDRLL